ATSGPVMGPMAAYPAQRASFDMVGGTLNFIVFIWELVSVYARARTTITPPPARKMRSSPGCERGSAVSARPIDLGHRAARKGPRAHQLERQGRGKVGEQRQALAQRHRGHQQDE